MGTLWQDLRYASRTLLNRPAFTIVAVLTLTLGIGANTAVFSVVHSVLLRPLPYPVAGQLVKVTGAGVVAPGRPRNLSRPDFQDFERDNTTLQSLGAHDAAIGAATLTGIGEAEHLRAVFVSGGFFRTLRTVPQLGRLIQPEDDITNPASIVIAHGLWQRRFGGDPSVIGRAVIIGGQSATIMGVLPAEFRYPQPDLLGDPDVYRPMGFGAQFVRSSRASVAIGRLKDGVTLEEAQHDLGGIAVRLEKAYPRDNHGADVIVRPLIDSVVGDSRQALWLLLGSVLCVLLIGCVNISNLLLAKSVGRRKEMAVRAALGASRGRILRQLLTESLLLGGIGGLCGVLAGQWALWAILSTSRGSVPRVNEISLNPGALLFSATLSTIAAIVFGAIPAFQTGKVSLEPALRDGGRSSRGATRRVVRNGLVIAEVALAIVLLTTAGLLIRSFAKLSNVDPGFASDKLLTAQVALPPARYPPGADVRFYDSLYESLGRGPGVRGVAAINILPLSGAHTCDGIRITAHPVPAGQEPCAETRSISASFFDVMGMPIIRGRRFLDTDNERSPNVVIVNQAMAERFWPGEDPIGQTMTLISLGEKEQPREVVGLVGNTKHMSLSESPAPEYYIPQHQFSYLGMTLVVRTTGEPSLLSAFVRSELGRLDPHLPLFNVRTFDDLLATTVARPRFQTTLLTAFATLALCLALAGVYGVLSYNVSQRVHEIGVRMCLGATGGQVVWLFVREAMIPVTVGTALGLIGATWTGRLVAGLLFGVSPSDLRTFVAAPLLLLAAALIATYAPARRATRIEASVALQGN